MELFYGRLSGNSARAVFGLNEVGVKHEQRLVDTQSGENQSPAYLAVNPMGKIPALRDGSVSLWESNAINFHAAEKHAPHLLGKNHAAVLRWQFFQSAHVSPACIHIFRAHNPKVQEFWKTKGDPAAAQAAQKELPRYVKVLEQALEKSDWLEGEFTLADIAFAPHFFLVRGPGFDFSPYPRVNAWLDRLFARPAWISARKTVVGE